MAPHADNTQNKPSSHLDLEWLKSLNVIETPIAPIPNEKEQKSKIKDLKSHKKLSVTESPPSATLSAKLDALPVGEEFEFAKADPMAMAPVN
ncbi:hypothetical protein CEP54_015231 [Fusarium duplospermum]|uniref:Uncharacterized protein n=1 Tax=Fusarium duplospermum TaxID=1325734 RepID=A0A428NQK2_9HYPO|nr:hypothetical protein CEP54_015231 [Fusarium duplospermum]